MISPDTRLSTLQISFQALLDGQHLPKPLFGTNSCSKKHCKTDCNIKFYQKSYVLELSEMKNSTNRKVAWFHY